MKTVDEIADYLAVYSRRDSVGCIALKDAIAQAMTEFAKEAKWSQARIYKK